LRVINLLIFLISLQGAMRLIITAIFGVKCLPPMLLLICRRMGGLKEKMGIAFDNISFLKEAVMKPWIYTKNIADKSRMSFICLSVAVLEPVSNSLLKALWNICFLSCSTARTL